MYAPCSVGSPMRPACDLIVAMRPCMRDVNFRSSELRALRSSANCAAGHAAPDEGCILMLFQNEPKSATHGKSRASCTGLCTKCLRRRFLPPPEGPVEGGCLGVAKQVRDLANRER